MATSKRTRSGRRKKETAELTGAEWKIMKVVWEKGPCAAGTVQEALVDTEDWAYATVKSIMDWMVKKGFLKVQKIRNLQLFHACIRYIASKNQSVYTP